MMKRTVPAISFHPSSINLMLRVSKPVLSAEMDSITRMQASWNELPFNFTGASKAEMVAWDDKRTYELGLRRVYYFTKQNWIMMNVTWFLAILLFSEFNYFPIWMAYYAGDGPTHLKRENGKEWTKKTYGIEVYCADGKFIRPHFHMTPPMFTMTADELA